MNETVDKIADKLITSIQKSQNSNTPSKPAETKTKTAPKSKTHSETGVKKIIDEVLTPTSIESPRKFVGRLRWPD